MTINEGGGLYTEVVHGVSGRDYARGLGEGGVIYGGVLSMGVKGMLILIIIF